MDQRLEFISEDFTDNKVVIGRLIELVIEEINRTGSTTKHVELMREIKASLATGSIAKNISTSPVKFEISPQEIHWLTKHEENKWVEYVTHRYKFLSLGESIEVPEFPPHLLIEPTSICNLRCVMCFQVDETFTRDKSIMGLMPWDLFTSVVDQAADNDCKAITMASRGEPTLHKQFGEMLRYTHGKGILDTKINTNATRLKEQTSTIFWNLKLETLLFQLMQ